MHIVVLVIMVVVGFNGIIDCAYFRWVYLLVVLYSSLYKLLMRHDFGAS